ncbi:MAG: ABC transporter ATP-binding protein [Deltaproteobacteria bacterium]|nr:ABC transporter ATP-binding protein [Deltaproteobacteria bacterium]
MTAIIEAIDLKKTYFSPFRRQRTEALRGVSISVKAGETFGLIGLNGAGKTTFIKSLLSVVRFDSGALTVLGGNPENPAVRAQIGYLPERLDLPRAFSARDFLRSVGRLKGTSDVDSQAQKLLNALGLSYRSRAKIGGFSKGMRQRLGLAGALMGRPRLLVLDEPTDGIDPIGRTEIRKILQEEKKQNGTTIFLNSHLLSETERVADRIAIIAHGKVVREGALQELCIQKKCWEVTVAPGGHVPQLMTTCGFVSAGEGDHRTWKRECDDAAEMNGLIASLISKGIVFEEFFHPFERLEEVLSNSLKEHPESVPPGGVQ